MNPSEAEMLSFWNPVVGGECILFWVYNCSVSYGAKAVNSLGQLRSALHLYNALRLYDPTLDIPFLKNLDTLYANIKCVWVGGKPDKGSCCKAYHMSFSMTARRTAQLASVHLAKKDAYDVGCTIDPGDLRTR